MKTSLNWLSDYIEINWNAEELTEILTLAGLEVEGVEQAEQLPETVVAGEILAREKHPNADKLSVCRVALGKGEPLQIVCGAPNCNPGIKVPVALIGTKLPGGFKIKKSKLRGVESQGMMCSPSELGLGNDESGLLELSVDAVPGEPLMNCLHPDTVIDWEVTPNRPDWLSHIGIAREIAALAGDPGKLRLPKPELEPLSESDIHKWISLQVFEPELCPRYTVRILRDVKIGASPDWLQKYLTAVGIRPINNVVDITNFVMLECGHPLHAFDYDKLSGSRLMVRRAGKGEEFVTLDQQKRVLNPDRLLIADEKEGIALAGVMGGANTEISSDTTTVLLESAAFFAANIRATARELGLHSESSYRFERGIDLEMVEFASRRAAALIQELAGAQLIQGSLDFYPVPWQADLVPCRFARVNSLLGVEIEKERVENYFQRLGLTVADCDSQVITVSIPSFRRDLQREADLIEEVARLYGLQNIPSGPVLAKAGGSYYDDAYFRIEEARNGFIGLGLTETMTYSTIEIKDGLKVIEGGEDNLIKLANPLSAEGACMRPSMVPGLLRTAAYNIARNNNDLSVFEIGRVLYAGPDFPEERYQAGVAMSGLAHPERYGDDRRRVIDFYDIKGIFEGWLNYRRLPAADCQPTEHPALMRGRAAEMRVDGKLVAVFGQVDDKLVRDIRLSHPLFIGLIELDYENELERPPKKAHPLPQYPAVSRDISMIVPNNLLHRDIVKSIRDCRCPWLEDVRVFDLYEDESSLGSGRRSLAYSLVYRDQNRTLTDDEVTAAHEKIKGALAERLDVEFR